MREKNAASFARTVAAVLVGVTVSVAGIAEDANNAIKLQTPAPAPSKVFGTLDLRGEYYSLNGQFDTANYAELGYQFNPDVKLSYYQGFDSNLKDSPVGDGRGGLNAVLDQGFIHTKVNNILKSGDWAFHYESRVYIPTWAPEIAQGNITRFYNAFKLSRSITPGIKLTVTEVAMPQVFRTAGVGSKANSWYQNRLYLIGDFTLSSKLSLSVPILWYQTKNREFAGASNSGTWEHLVYIWPELDYALTENLSLGLAYQSGNLMKADLSGMTLSDGFKTGNFQFALITTI